MVIEPESSMLAEMLAPWSALVIAALSESVTLANRIRCGDVATIDQASQPAATRPTRNRKGRLRFTAGWARISPICRSGLKLAGSAAPSEGVSALLISDRHAHDVLVGGEELVADLQGRLEADRGLLTGEHHLGDVHRL